jgi:hypothetical protein
MRAWTATRSTRSGTWPDGPDCRCARSGSTPTAVCCRHQPCPAGYRRYDLDALARLDLVRTLRDLGVDLATIQRVLDREISVPEVAAAHAEALDVQIRTLRLRRAVLRAVAKRGSSP